VSALAAARGLRRRGAVTTDAAAAAGGGARAEAPAARLAAFAALGAFAAAHWARLVAEAPVGRVALTVALAAGMGAGLLALPRTRLRPPALHAAALAVAIGGGVVALVTIGLPARLLPPGAWDELSGEIDRGLAGIRTVEWPYEGSDDAIRLVVLLGAPLLLTVAAALAFWPARRGAGVMRGLGLITLLLLYGVPVTEHDPGAPLVRGLLLLALVGAWLWLPRLRGRDATVGAAVLAAVGVGALPVAAKLDSERALLDYRSWNWFAGEGITFDWNHSYGPLDWPRKGTTLLNVEADKPQYWKVETLDSFDGLRWLRTDANESTEFAGELPPNPDPRWDERIRVTVRSLRTDFVVGTGTPYRVDGAGEAVTGSADGTVRRLDEPLRRGDSYTVRSYAPDPSARRMRAATGSYPRGLSQYTRISLPRPGETARPDARPAAATARQVSVPLAGPREAVTAGLQPALASSPYAKSYGLARRLTAGAPTVYDAVDRVQDHLRDSYTYSERPPTRAYPLESFLFDDRIGYCQQFSGSMALMLRMVGIPTRVVSGFSPGSFNRDRGEFSVRDLDAHSWVEVYFAGIGWATFDPTPRAAPADRAGRGPEAERLDIPTGGETRSGSGEPFSSERGSQAESPAATGRAEEKGPNPLAAVLVAAGVIGAALLVAGRRRRSQRRGGDATESSLRELELALPRL